MTNAANRILEAVHGDTDAIRTLAGAVARNDLGAVQQVLVAHGLTLSDDEVASVVGGARSGGADAMNCTCTCTCT